MNTNKPRPSAFPKRVLPYLLSMAMIIAAAVTPSFGYEEDTHFLMTYALCRSAGFTAEEALIVAAVDQGMDDSIDTNAHDGGKPQVLEEWLWHALDKDGDMHAAGVIGRRDALFNDAVNDRDPLNRLIRLGIFFHYQQDTWAHRHHEKDNHLSLNAFTTFNTPTGHGPWGSAPDRPPLDPVAALMSLEDGIVYAADFLKRAMGRKPNPFLSDYAPSGGKTDAAWIDKRNGRYFRQIDTAGLPANSARQFLASLIRSQIDAYVSGRSSNPFYVPQATADKVEFEKVKASLQSVCDRFKTSVGTILLPSQTEKSAQGFTKMTTLQLLSLRPGSKEVPAPKP